ncbi:MAG: hypothetical protein FJW09_04105 [Actinobacteria bacterium]|nr:hypothetical protein [Actinomycetota bacterium]
MTVSDHDERAHSDALHEEWSFAWWDATVASGGYTSYRLRRGATSWYCWGWWRRDHPLMHVVEFDIPRRSDPMIAKAEAMWAEYTCESALEQWTIGNETLAVELGDPAEALGRVRGTLVPVASDLEWYATARVESTPDGYRQRGVLLGEVETRDGRITIDECDSVRTHRWSTEPLSVDPFDVALAHLDARIPFRFPDGSVLDLVATPDGWARRS